MSATAAQFLPWLFPKLLGGVYFLAFSSLLAQVLGLYGSCGVLPIGVSLTALREWQGTRAYRICPSLFWFGSSDRVLIGAALLAVVLSLLLIAGAPPVPLLFLLWLLYLSFVTAGQEFLSYQWDTLLLETGFMTIFLPLVTPAPFLVVFTYRFFLFRFIFSAGAVKLLSGDPAWRNLTALCYHYETQPLPNRLGWYAHHLPVAMQKLSTLGTFFFELAVPLLALGPAPARLACFFLLIYFQGLIFATGNYGFFNILTMVLSVPLLDDRHFRLAGDYLAVSAATAGGTGTVLVSIIFALFLCLNICRLVMLFFRPHWLSRLLAVPSSLMISNPYGLFAVMTTNRYEFVIEGSNDRKKWEPYEFRWKPGDPRRPPRQAAPHQPRLDWQMWFAALDPRTIEPWLDNLQLRLLQGSPTVLALFRLNPFPGIPPRFIRLTIYSYRFADLRVRRSEGKWWERELIGRSETMSLREEGEEKA
jgi:hypothetical protein